MNLRKKENLKEKGQKNELVDVSERKKNEGNKRASVEDKNVTTPAISVRCRLNTHLSDFMHLLILISFREKKTRYVLNITY